MKTKKNVLAITAIVIVSFLLGCSKEGVSGPQGQQGPQGTAGINGTNGVANISTTLFTIKPSEWGVMGGGEYEYGYVDSALKNADSDAIEVFYEADIYPNLYRAVPCYNLFVSGDELSYDYATGIVDVFYFSSSAPSSTMVIKVVITPPSIMLQHPNTNWKNHSQVNAVINTLETN